MKSDRFYPIALVTAVAVIAAIATAFVGSTRDSGDTPSPVKAAISAPAQR
jgi:hypothetical protein